MACAGAQLGWSQAHAGISSKTPTKAVRGQGGRSQRRVGGGGLEATGKNVGMGGAAQCQSTSSRHQALGLTQHYKRKKEGKINTGGL